MLDIIVLIFLWIININHENGNHFFTFLMVASLFYEKFQLLYHRNGVLSMCLIRENNHVPPHMENFEKMEVHPQRSHHISTNKRDNLNINTSMVCTHCAPSDSLNRFDIMRFFCPIGRVFQKLSRQIFEIKTNA